MSKQMDLEDLGGDEIAADFTGALVKVIESRQTTVMDYDLDKGIYIRITVQPLTEAEFNSVPADE